MDLAYDHIQEEAFPDEPSGNKEGQKAEQSTLNKDFQEAYKAISSSPWGAKLGGFFGSVVKQVSTSPCTELFSPLTCGDRGRVYTKRHSKSLML